MRCHPYGQGIGFKISCSCDCAAVPSPQPGTLRLCGKNRWRDTTYPVRFCTDRNLTTRYIKKEKPLKAASYIRYLIIESFTQGSHSWDLFNVAS